MNQAEYQKQFNEMYAEYKKYYYDSDEAKKIWGEFHGNINKAKEAFRVKKQNVINRVFDEIEFPKLSSAQKEVVSELISKMYEAKLGKQTMLDHYEIWEHAESTTDFVFDVHYNLNKFFIRSNTRTLKKLEEMGILRILSVGGNYCDDVTPCFDFELTDDDKNI